VDGVYFVGGSVFMNTLLGVIFMIFNNDTTKHHGIWLRYDLIDDM